MKRVFALCLVLALILPVLAVSAMAATSYMFYPDERMLLDENSFDFGFSEDYEMMIYEGEIPDGRYRISMQLGDTLFYTPDPVDIIFEYSDDPEEADMGLQGCFFDFTLGFDGASEGITFSSVPCAAAKMSGMSFFVIGGAAGGDYSSVEWVRFDLIESYESDPMDSIFSGVSVFSAVLNELFSLIINNPLLAAFCAASLIGVGVVVYRSAKDAAR